MRENALELHGVCKKYGGFALRKRCALWEALSGYMR